MNKEFTLAQLVKKYGSKAQKESLKRNKGNLSGKEFDILLKEVLTEWESHKVKDGRGSKRIITCIGKRSSKAERVDKRSNNGQGQLIGEFELKSLVVCYLIQNKNKVRPMSATKWITELGIVDGKFTGALYGARGEHLEKLQVQFSKMIKNYHKADSDIDMLDGFLQTFLRHLKGSLESVFNKLSKAEVITHKKEQWGCTTKNRHRKLKRQEIKTIEGIRHKLLHFHGIEVRDLFMTNIKEVKAFKKDFEEQLEEQLGLKFYYHAHYCVLQENDLGVRDYLDRLQEKNELNFTHKLTEQHVIITMEMFKGIHSERSLELANGRQKNITNTSDSDRVKSLKIMKQYAPMWELLLKYFRCTSSKQLNTSAVKKAEIPIEIDGDKYVDCIRNFNISATESEGVEVGKHRIDEHMKKELAQLGLSNLTEIKNEKSVKNGIRNYHETYMDTEQHEELTMKEIIDQKQANQTNKEIEIEKIKQQSTIFVDKPINEPPLDFYEIEDYEYQEVMADIKEEIREYEDKYGDRAMEHMALDAVIREIETERASVKWDKLFEGGKPVKWGHTTNKPLELFHRIRDGHIC